MIGRPKNPSIRQAFAWRIRHICARREWFSTYEPLENTKHVTIGDGSNLYATGRGNINIMTYVNGIQKRNYLANVLHVPGLKFNLFSNVPF